MINVLIVEDNAVVRDSMMRLFAYQSNLAVVGGAEDGHAALALLASGLKPDIILADLNMPGMDGIELTLKITSLYKKMHVVILTMHDKYTFVERAFAAGARGFLLKDGDIDKLCESISSVFNGETILDPNLSRAK